jgi:uncharacterized protein YlzI (FlbEa/FlbD family)
VSLIAFGNSHRAGESIWINPQHVVCVREVAEHSVITLSDGTELTVGESIAQVVGILTGRVDAGA